MFLGDAFNEEGLFLIFVANLYLESGMLNKMPLAELFEAAKGYNFEFDWFTISARDLDERHSINGCMG